MSSEFGADKTGAELEQLCADTLRILAMDGVEKAGCGHPGMPMGMADVAHLLWSEVLRLDPEDPGWIGRDRFVLSAGHGSMLIYGLLHLAGFGLELDELKNFRQLGSRTPGHPESHDTPGVETTTGPLGQGFANAVGMALAERHLVSRFPEAAELIGQWTFVICGDGDLQEGVAAEAASLAGHLRLGRLVVLYDDNHISIDGPTELSFSEDVLQRFAAYGWLTERVDGHDPAAVRAALKRAAVDQDERPVLIACRTVIGKHAPTKANTAGVHGSKLGAEELKATKEAMGWPQEPFLVPGAVHARWEARRETWRGERAAWNAKWSALETSHPETAAALTRWFAEATPDLSQVAWPSFEAGKSLATRKASLAVLQALAAALPNLIGGSADLTGSNGTELKGLGVVAPGDWAGRNIHYGVREHAMASMMNGMALHGALIPFGGTFLVFSDYSRPAMRLAALMHQRVVHVMTHDSVLLGEDGPTHQPVEHVMSLRMIPGLRVIRPADATETGPAWRAALEYAGPSVLSLTRQGLPVLDRSETGDAEGVLRGGYVLWERGGAPQLVLIATGSEVAVALDAARALAAEDGVAVRVVSLPCWELFDAQDAAYRESVIPPACKTRVSIEAGVTLGWERYVGGTGLRLGIDRFGASAPAAALAEFFQLSPGQVLARVRQYLKDSAVA